MSQTKAEYLKRYLSGGGEGESESRKKKVKRKKRREGGDAAAVPVKKVCLERHVSSCTHALTHNLT